MAVWKRFTGAVDTSAQSFLKNKKFSREKKKFTLDWHLWNFALMSTPSVLLAYYLHGVEERMREEAAIREEIQERTGVSSRGFLIPKREVREEVLGMLSAGNQRGMVNDDKARGRQEQAGEVRDGGEVSSDLKSIQGRLAAIESMLGVRSGPDPKTTGAGVGDGPGPGKNSATGDTSTFGRGEEASNRSTATTVENSGADATSGATVEKAIATASAVGSWVLESGERQGKRLVRKGREWLAGISRREETRSGEFGENNGEIERRTPKEAVSEEPRQEQRSGGEAPDRVRNSTTSDVGDGSLSPGTSKKGNAEGAWRQGRLDEDDK